MTTFPVERYTDIRLYSAMAFCDGTLTHWVLNKAADILHTTFWNILLYKGMVILIEIPLKFDGSVNSNSALVQIMAWCQAGSKSFPEPVMIKYYDNV